MEDMVFILFLHLSPLCFSLSFDSWNKLTKKISEGRTTKLLLHGLTAELATHDPDVALAALLRYRTRTGTNAFRKREGDIFRETPDCVPIRKTTPKTQTLRIDNDVNSVCVCVCAFTQKCYI